MRTLLALVVMLPLATQAEVTCDQAFAACMDKATKLEKANVELHAVINLQDANLKLAMQQAAKAQSDRDLYLKEATTAREWNKWLVAGGIGAFALGIVGGIIIQSKLSK